MDKRQRVTTIVLGHLGTTKKWMLLSFELTILSKVCTAAWVTQLVLQWIHLSCLQCADDAHMFPLRSVADIFGMFHNIINNNSLKKTTQNNNRLFNIAQTRDTILASDCI